MKFLSNLRTRLRKNLLKNNAGQGATEYILLLVVVVGLVVAFGPKVKKMVEGKTEFLGGKIDSVTGE